MTKRYILFLVTFLVTQKSYAQLPEQDCISAIPVCQSTYFQPLSYINVGNTDEITYGFNSSCLQGGEQNSVWYIFTVTDPGNLEFSITPGNVNDDYDWNIYNLTGNDCSGIINGTAPEVRCNYSAIPGPTGCASPYTLTSVPAGGPPWCSPLPVLTAETYVLMINNHANSNTGYTLQFSGTAVIFDTVPPKPISIDPFTCRAPDTLHITISEPIRCNSIAANGTDFYITGPSAANVIGAYSPGCTAGTFTNDIYILLQNQITVNGDYVLRFKLDDTYFNTLLDNCGNSLHWQDTVPFTISLAKAQFSSKIIKTCKGDSVLFTDFSVGDTVNSWNWDFSDGTTSTLENPNHVYPNTGTYTITLIIADTSGCSDTASIVVTTYIEPPVSSFTVSPGPYCAGITVDFTNTSTGQGLFYEWNFGGTTTNIKDPQFDFNTGGLWDVVLVVIDSIGCSDTSIITLDISPALNADFSVSPSVLCVGEEITLSDASLGNPTSFYWTGNGITGQTSTEVTTTFTDSGTYQFQLIIDNPVCDPDTAFKEVRVYSYPVVYLGADTDICIDESITLNAQNPAYYHLWYTGDTTQFITLDMVPQMASVLVDNHGCTSHDTILVGSACPFYIPNAFTPNGDGINDLFKIITDGNQSFVFSIYNRWGQMVFQTTDPDEGWDGNFEGRPEEMGVFVYQLETIFTNGVKKTRRGNITLIR